MIFDLLVEPWLPVVRAGKVEHLGIRDVLMSAGTLDSLVAETPSMRYALHRLLLSIVQRVVLTEKDWESAWASGDIDVDTYLDRWRDRFDLEGPAPFLQIGGLAAAGKATTTLDSLVPRSPLNGVPRKTLSPAEAARWLVHLHAYAVKGIRPGTLGDPRVSGGRSYPTGPGWGHLCDGILLEGSTLARTLLLNVLPGLPGSPVWERDVASTRWTPAVPDGPLALYTWPSRRVLLTHREGTVVGALVSNGGMPSGVRDPMTSYRDNGRFRRPRTSVWAFLPEMFERPPQTLGALAARPLDGGERITVTMVSTELDPHGSKWVDETVTGHTIPASLLTEENERDAFIAGANYASSLRGALIRLDGSLRAASGGPATESSETVARIDDTFERIASDTPPGTPDFARRTQAVARELGRDLYGQTPQNAWSRGSANPNKDGARPIPVAYEWFLHDTKAFANAEDQNGADHA